MIRWKVRLQPMRLLLASIVFLSSFTLSGCRLNPGWAWSTWLTQLALKGGFSAAETTAIEDLNKFQILNVYEYDFDELLNVEMVQYTCDSLIESNTHLKDVLNDESLKEQDVLNHEQAELLLHWLVEQMNDFGSENRMKLTYPEEVISVTVVDRKDNWFCILEEVELNQWIEDRGLVYQVIDIQDEWVKVRSAEFEDLEEVDVSGSMKFNFEEAVITFQNEIIELNQSVGAGLPASMLSQSLQIHGFQVRFSASSDSLHVYVSKKTESNLPLFLQFDINEIQCSVKWKSKQEEVDQAAMKLSYETSLTSGFRTSRYENRVLDGSKINPEQILNSLRQAFVKQQDCIEETIELAEIQLPFPNMPVVTLKMKLFLNLYASGRAEIAFESDHVIGFEKINDQIRWIHETEKDSNVSFRASTKASTKLQFLISIFNRNCMDAAAELGIEGTAVTKLNHLNSDITLESDVPYEMAEGIIQNQNDWMTCADLNVNWLFQLIFNSSQSLLGRFGFGRTIEIIDEDNGSVFGKMIHLENFMPVEKCTYSTRTTALPQLDSTSDRIELKRYVIVMNQGDVSSIVLGALPEGSEISDVIYSSMNSEIAEVDSSGKVTALSSGQTIIRVSLKDGSHEVQCSIFVR